MNIERQAGELQMVAASLNKRIADISNSLTPEQKQNPAIIEGLENLDNAMESIYTTSRRFGGAS